MTMRKVIRNILVNIGVKNIHEQQEHHGPGSDPHVGTDSSSSIGKCRCSTVPSWWVRARRTFPVPDVPIIMLTGHVERWRVIEGLSRLGVNEFLKKPVSGKSLLDPDAVRDP